MSQQGRRSEDEDRLDENPYAAPLADLGRMPHGQEPGDDDKDIRRRRRRARILRLGGLIGLIKAVLVLLSFGLGTLSQLGGPNSLEAQGIEPWMQRRWVARMSSVLCLALVAAWACWGLYLLRVWARWLLTCVAVMPIPFLAGGWVLVVGGFEPGVPGGIDPTGCSDCPSRRRSQASSSTPSSGRRVREWRSHRKSWKRCGRHPESLPGVPASSTPSAFPSPSSSGSPFCRSHGSRPWWQWG